jgi:hypothetical protein
MREESAQAREDKIGMFVWLQRQVCGVVSSPSAVHRNTSANQPLMWRKNAIITRFFFLTMAVKLRDDK